MKVIIIDDEQLAVDYLERQLMKINNIEIIGKFIDPIAGRSEIFLKDVDLVFLDISLPEINGIELAEQILEKKPDLRIVFVTAYNEYAVKAFELNALDYIVKPIRADRLIKTINRISEHESKQDSAEMKTYTMRMNIFRQVTVEASNGQFSVIQWRTTKSQELFLYLLQHRRQLVRKSVLIDLLWPEYEPDKVYSQLYTAIYHIRKTMARFGGENFQIINLMEGYILNIDHVLLDVEEWESQIESAPSLSFETIDQYMEIMKLYTGHYLQEYDYWWAENERQRLKQLWLSISYKIADLYENNNQLDKAIVWFLEICNQHMQEERAYFALMKIYASMNNHVLVDQQYSSLITNLWNEFNEPPRGYITDWYNQWDGKINKS
ncbi:response regulator [Paenibacillus glacialis]|uniref:Response regulator receiver protein n=1 Tax=Paenibacillus glacialis TaxID=494026 RepID=A0A168NMS9_9BACL|nr:response regulator [Paenibacillus glacialis]OAB45947.1 response regulator receiver protein [Paenibacillus glacialis]